MEDTSGSEFYLPLRTFSIPPHIHFGPQRGRQMGRMNGTAYPMEYSVGCSLTLTVVMWEANMYNCYFPIEGLMCEIGLPSRHSVADTTKFDTTHCRPKPRTT